MEKDKLYKQATLAACNYATHDEDEPCIDMDFYAGFKQGAEWLQSQPIADRLTEEEKDKVREYMASLRYMHIQCIHPSWEALQGIFFDLLGKEMFEKE